MGKTTDDLSIALDTAKAAPTAVSTVTGACANGEMSSLDIAAGKLALAAISTAAAADPDSAKVDRGRLVLEWTLARGSMRMTAIPVSSGELAAIDVSLSFGDHDDAAAVVKTLLGVL